jgi:2'-5' RNA ligase
MSERGDLRLFVAIYPPQDAARHMLRALAKLDPSPDARHRVTRLDQLHMTVQFIGDVPARELEDVVESVQRSAAGVLPFSLTPRRLVTLPERGTPRLIAVETDLPAGLQEVHRRLAQRLSRKPRAGSADRFLPHITVCRFTGSANPAPVDAMVISAPFAVECLTLVRSTLSPDGAKHEAILDVRITG